MKIQRSLYEKFYELKYYPEWICPQCMVGTLSCADNGVKTFEFQSSKKLRNEDGWEPHWISGAFVGILKCSNRKCEGVTAFSGDMCFDVSVIDIEEPPYHDTAMVEHIAPKYFNPPLKIIPIQDYYPKKVISCLKESFNLFWVDDAACANKIRVAVEAILDERKIAKTHISKKHKRVVNSLHKRLEIFKTINPEVGHLLLATKWIGNEGSHQLYILKREDIIVAYEILYQCLDKLYNPHPHALFKIAKTINKNKGVKKKRTS